MNEQAKQKIVLRATSRQNEDANFGAKKALKILKKNMIQPVNPQRPILRTHADRQTLSDNKRGL
jgi:hypothetical protein